MVQAPTYRPALMLCAHRHTRACHTVSWDQTLGQSSTPPFCEQRSQGRKSTPSTAPQGRSSTHGGSSANSRVSQPLHAHVVNHLLHQRKHEKRGASQFLTRRKSTSTVSDTRIPLSFQALAFCTTLEPADRNRLPRSLRSKRIQGQGCRWVGQFVGWRLCGCPYAVSFLCCSGRAASPSQQSATVTPKKEPS